MRINDFIGEYYAVWFGMNGVYDMWAKKHGTTYNNLFVLYIIAESEEGCTSHEICEKLLLPKQTVGSILDGFERSGYIKKDTSEKDKRSKLLSLTEAGRVYADTLLGKLYLFEQQAFKDVKESDMKKFLAANKKLFAVMKKQLQEDF